MRWWKKLRRTGFSHPAELSRAREVTEASGRQAQEDLRLQRELLAHESRTVTGPLRDERVKVNHLSVLAQNALWGR
jgi:hypothetical protein